MFRFISDLSLCGETERRQVLRPIPPNFCCSNQRFQVAYCWRAYNSGSLWTVISVCQCLIRMAVETLRVNRRKWATLAFLTTFGSTAFLTTLGSTPLLIARLPCITMDSDAAKSTRCLTCGWCTRACSWVCSSPQLYDGGRMICNSDAR